MALVSRQYKVDGEWNTIEKYATENTLYIEVKFLRKSSVQNTKYTVYSSRALLIVACLPCSTEVHRSRAGLCYFSMGNLFFQTLVKLILHLFRCQSVSVCLSFCLPACSVWLVIFNYATDNLRGQRLTEESMMMSKMKAKLEMCVCVCCVCCVCACAAVD